MHRKQWTASKNSCFSLSLLKFITVERTIYILLFQVLSLISVALTFSCHALSGRKKGKRQKNKMPQNEWDTLFLLVGASIAVLVSQLPVFPSLLWTPRKRIFEVLSGTFLRLTCVFIPLLFWYCPLIISIL